LALTRWYASQTTHLEITNGLSLASGKHSNQEPR
jgi:hypothetical protein